MVLVLRVATFEEVGKGGQEEEDEVDEEEEEEVEEEDEKEEAEEQEETDGVRRGVRGGVRRPCLSRGDERRQWRWFMVMSIVMIVGYSKTDEGSVFREY
jgi:hypothetical protein